ncbi:hypothetical protein LX32DRAFT_443901 [Colletotrichum zoysiae]|uniref:Uncharacterized protein n=1 Tax=Colletotrichum zoysiae TaxID=1216348 RepID=A0AAD9HSA1_9PEZI|nr:hypothetical protein LX32DRAFT_443901 [Colletotrichum zoysiae]
MARLVVRDCQIDIGPRTDERADAVNGLTGGVILTTPRGSSRTCDGLFGAGGSPGPEQTALVKALLGSARKGRGVGKTPGVGRAGTSCCGLVGPALAARGYRVRSLEGELGRAPCYPELASRFRQCDGSSVWFREVDAA